jgi:hypothetical protein
MFRHKEKTLLQVEPMSETCQRTDGPMTPARCLPELIHLFSSLPLPISPAPSPPPVSHILAQPVVCESTRAFSPEIITYLQDKYGSQAHHNHHISCGKYTHRFNPILTCIHTFQRRYNRPESRNCYCQIDRNTKHVGSC